MSSRCSMRRSWGYWTQWKGSNLAKAPLAQHPVSNTSGLEEQVSLPQWEMDNLAPHSPWHPQIRERETPQLQMCIVLQTRSDLTDVNIDFFIHKLVASCSTMLLLSSHHLLQPTDFAGGRAKKLSHLMLPSQPLHSTTLQSRAVTGVGGPFRNQQKLLWAPIPGEPRAS